MERHLVSRRSVLAGGGALAAATAASASTAALGRVWSVREPGGARLRHAAIGCGGMGLSDLRQIASHPDVDVVALCDVDSAKFKAAEEFAPGARRFADYREMIAEMGDELDSCHISTPDHMHGAIAMAAMGAGLHVYGQKPLTRTVAEARALARRAKEAGVVTQMGIQNHSNANYDGARRLFETGVIGKVHAVHVWTDRPGAYWKQGLERPDGSDPVPASLDWDLWLGVAPERPYKAGLYHTFHWRGRQDFGTGAQGDMACHLMDPAPWFLGLGAPLTLRSDGPVPTEESFPLWSRVHYTFPGNDLTTPGPLPLTWYDGGKLPPVDLLAEHGTDRASIPANACMFVGTEGALIANPYGKCMLLPEERFVDLERPAGKAKHHWHEWVDACLGRGEPSAPFDYSASLTEIALLGNIALRYPHRTIRWDHGAMRFPGLPEADGHLRPTVRAGWSIDGL